MAVKLEDFVKMFEDRRKTERKNYFILVGIGAVLIVVGIILFVMGFLNGDEMFAALLIGIGLVFAGLIVLSIGLTRKKKYLRYCFTTLDDAVTKDIFPQSVKDSKRGLLYNELMKPGFFATPDRYIGRDYLTSVYDGISFEKAHYDLQRRQETTDSKGHTTVTYVSFAVGTMYRFVFERDFGQEVKVLERKGILSVASGGLKKVETEFIAFNKKFMVLASDDTTVFYLLTPQIQEKIMSLESRFKGQFYLAFIGNELFIATNDNDETIAFPWSVPVTAESLQPIVETMAIPAVFIKLMGLNKTKFLHNAGAEFK